MLWLDLALWPVIDPVDVVSDLFLLRKDWTVVIFSEGWRGRVNIVLTQCLRLHCGRAALHADCS